MSINFIELHRSLHPNDETVANKPEIVLYFAESVGFVPQETI